MSTATCLDGALPLPKALAASGLPIHLSTVTRWCRLGLIPALRIGGRWYARPDQLRAAVKEVGNGR